MTQTLETGKKTTLSKVLNPADTVMDVATAPTVTKGRAYLFNGQQEERCSYNGIIGNQLQNVVRNLSQTAIPATSGTGLKWIAGTRVKFVAMHDQLVDRGEDITFAGKIDFGSNQGRLKFPEYTTAQRDAILTWENGEVITNTTTGTDQQYLTGAWTDFGSSTTPNASTTVAGKVEIATLGQQQNGDTTGETWALLVSTPDYVKTVNDTAATAALQIKSKVDVASATTANITLSGVQTIDGVAGAAAQRVLVKAQTAGAENGIWLQNAGSWTRATDFDANTNNEVDLGATVWVNAGTVNAGTQWTLTTTGAITVGTIVISFVQTYPVSAGSTALNNKLVAVTSTTARISADTERGMISSTPALMKSIRIPHTGTINMYYETRSNNVSEICLGQIRRWTETLYSDAGAGNGYVAFNVDLRLNEWDIVDLWIYRGSGSGTSVNCKNYRARYDVSLWNVGAVITD